MFPIPSCYPVFPESNIPTKQNILQSTEAEVYNFSTVSYTPSMDSWYENQFPLHKKRKLAMENVKQAAWRFLVCWCWRVWSHKLWKSMHYYYYCYFFLWPEFWKDCIMAISHHYSLLHVELDQHDIWPLFSMKKHYNGNRAISLLKWCNLGMYTQLGWFPQHVHGFLPHLDGLASGR